MVNRLRLNWRLSYIPIIAIFLTALGSSAPVCYCQDALLQLEQNLQDRFSELGPSVVEISVDLSESLQQPAQASTLDASPAGHCESRHGFAELHLQQEKRMGTGVIFDHDYRILTADALLRGITPGASYRIDVQTSFHTFFEATIVGTDPVSGIAVLEPKPDRNLSSVLEQLRPARFGEAEEVRAGNIVLMVSSCFGMNNSAFWGVVSGRQQWLDCYLMHDYIQTTLPLQPGTVGAPVCNLKGEVVGLMAASFRQTPWQEVSFAIPSSRFIDVLPTLIEDGCVHRGYLGVCIADLTEEKREELEISEDLDGVVVARVLEGSPAAQASMKAGDLILSIGSKEVSSVHQVLWIVANTTPNTKVKMALVRGGKPQAAEVILGDSCSNVFKK